MATTTQEKSSSVARICIAIISAYQYVLSPWLGQQCRFFPSCSCYAKQAFAEYGFGKGIWLTLKRLSRCHPFCKGGCDPVPKK